MMPRWDSERDFLDCLNDRTAKRLKEYHEKRVVFLQEKRDECTTEECKIRLDVKIIEAMSESAWFRQQYFERTAIHLPPLQNWELYTKKMTETIRLKNATKRAMQDALVDTACGAMSLAHISM